jgi:hypothetical protein
MAYPNRGRPRFKLLRTAEFPSEVDDFSGHRYGLTLLLCLRGGDSSVGRATRYGMDRPRVESRWGRDFPHPYIPDPGPPSLKVGSGPFPGVKRSGHGIDHPPPSGAQLGEG